MLQRETSPAHPLLPALHCYPHAACLTTPMYPSCNASCPTPRSTASPVQFSPTPGSGVCVKGRRAGVSVGEFVCVLLPLPLARKRSAPARVAAAAATPPSRRSCCSHSYSWPPAKGFSAAHAWRIDRSTGAPSPPCCSCCSALWHSRLRLLVVLLVSESSQVGEASCERQARCCRRVHSLAQALETPTNHAISLQPGNERLATA